MKFKRLLSTLAAAALLTTGVMVTTPAAQAAPLLPMPLEIRNHSGRTDPLYIYVMGRSESGQVGWLDAGGNFHQLTGAPANVPAPVGDISIQGPTTGNTLTISSPILSSGRIYYSYGQKLTINKVLDGDGISNFVYPSIFNESDPNKNVLHGSAEYSLVRHPDGNTGLWFNSTQVDFVGPPVQVGVQREDGSVYSIGRLKENGLQNIESFLQSKPGWGGLVKKHNGEFLRILSAKDGLEDGALSPNTIQPYIDQVWNKYRNEDLKVRPFSGEFDMPELIYTGRVGGDNLLRFTHNLSSLPQYSENPKYASIMAHPTLTFGKPTPKDVYGCEGYRDGVVTLLGSEANEFGGFGNGGVARTMCAAYNRGTLLSNPNQPDTNPANYFQNEYANWYVQAVHDQMVSGRSYAFAFDDVGEQESLVAATNPQKAFLQLDPFTGSASPIGEEEGVDDDNPGGGDDGDGGNPGGGDDGDGGDGGNPGGGDDGENPGGGDNGGGDDGDGGDGGNPGGGDDGENPGGGDNGGNNGDGGSNPGGDQSPGGNGDGGADTDKGTQNPSGSITLGTMLGASVKVSPERPTGKRQWHTRNVQISAQGIAPAGTTATLQIKIGQAAWATYTGPVMLKKAGKTRVQVRVVAGHQSSPVDSVRVKLDKKAPTKLKAKTSKRGIKLRAKDKTSKVAKIRYRMKRKGGGWTKWRTYKGKRIKASANVQRIRVRAIDKAGNKRVKTFKVKARR